MRCQDNVDRLRIIFFSYSKISINFNVFESMCDICFDVECTVWDLTNVISYVIVSQHSFIRILYRNCREIENTTMDAVSHCCWNEKWCQFISATSITILNLYLFTCIMFYNNKMYSYMNTNHIVEAFCIAITSKNAIHKKILMIKSFGVEIEKMLCFWEAVNSIQIIMKWNEMIIQVKIFSIIAKRYSFILNWWRWKIRFNELVTGSNSIVWIGFVLLLLFVKQCLDERNEWREKASKHISHDDKTKKKEKKNAPYN